MLRGDFMPRAHNAALEQREGGFHSVGVNIAMRVLFGVIDSPVQVLLHFIECPRVDLRFIGHNHFYMAANVGVDNLPHGLRLRILSANHPKVAVALPDANYDSLVRLRTPSASLAANVGFVNLDRATKFLWCYFQHGRSDSMAKVPRRLVADSERALNLAGRHA